jgi:prepilin-type N-terminal cleavage/methylation domain-containing protein
MRPTLQHIRHRGFSLIEVIVAVTIMAVIVTMIAVRISGTQGKQITLLGDQLGDMLMMFALRSEHAPYPIAILMDTDYGTINLVRRTPPEREGGEATWQPDPVVRPVSVPDFLQLEAIEFFADDSYIDIVQWPLTSMPGQDRPEIEIRVGFEGRTISLRLPPHAIYAARRDSSITNSQIEPRLAEDLDATGRWQEDW